MAEKLELNVPKDQYEDALAIIMKVKGKISFGEGDSFKLDVDRNLGRILDHLDYCWIDYQPGRWDIEQKYGRNAIYGDGYDDIDIFDILGGII